MGKPYTQVLILSVAIAQCLHGFAESSEVVDDEVVDDDLKVLPNVGYLLSGYNIFKGNPQTSMAGVDPGFTSATIYESVVSGRTTSDKRYSVPDNTTIKKDYGCALSFASAVTFKSSEYEDNMKLSVTADFEGFGASFSSSVDYTSFEQYTATSKMKRVSSTAECVQYTGGIDAYAPPSFTGNFQAGLSQLPAEYGDGELYFDFIDVFGTHLVASATMGARFGFNSYLDEESSKKIEETGIKLAVAARYEGIVKVGGSVSDENTRKATEEFSKSSQHTGIITLGAKPTSTDEVEWAKQVIEEPMPIRYTLRKICDALKQDTQKMSNCNTALTEYCQKRLKLSRCDAPHDGDLVCLWDSDCSQDQSFHCVNHKCEKKPAPPKELRSNDMVNLRNIASGLYFKDVRAAGTRKGWPHGRLGEPAGNFQLLLENPAGPIQGDGRTLLRIRSETTTSSGYDFMYASDQGGIYFDLDTASEDKQWWKITKVTSSVQDDNILRDGDSVMLENKYQPGTYLQKYQDAWVYSLQGKDTWQVRLSSSKTQQAALLV